MSDQHNESAKKKSKKGFPEGHPGFPSRRRKMVTRQLSTAVRERIDADVYVEWHLAIVAGHDPLIVEEGDPRWPSDQPGQPASECGLRVVWQDRGGIPPSLEQRSASIKWLADRGYGQAPQMITLEAELRGQLAERTGELPVGVLAPALLSGIRALLGKPPAENHLPILNISSNEEVLVEESEDTHVGA